jgi:hypothetical protein
VCIVFRGFVACVEEEGGLENKEKKKKMKIK